MAIKNTLIRRPKAIVRFEPITTGARLNTTIVGEEVVGQTQIAVTDSANWVVGPAQIGDGEDIERVDILSASGNTITLARPLLRTHKPGAVIRAMAAIDCGDIDGDAMITLAKESSDQFSAMRFLAFTQLHGNTTATFGARLLGTTVQNLALAAGIPTTAVTGVGTMADPLVFQTDFSDVDSRNDVCFAVVAQRQDGTPTVFEFWGVGFDYTGIAVQLAKAQNGAIPIKVQLLGALAQFDAAPVFVATQAQRATKGKVFREVRAIGTVAPTGTSTTVAVAADAGDYVLEVADAAGVAPNDWILVGLEDTVELHWVRLKSGNELTLRSPLLRRQEIGVRVVEALRTPFGALAVGGATFTVGGSTSPTIVENRDLPIAMNPQSVQAGLTFSVHDLSLASIAAAAGKSPSSIANNAMLLSEGLLNAGIDCFYVEGATQDGTVCILSVWGCTQDLANFALALGGQNPVSVPYSLKPASGVQFLQYQA